MYYISLDLEWNQAYAEKSLAVQKKLSCRLRGEVIQIGAVKLDKNMIPCGSYSVIVKPKYFQRIHRQVEKLTGITQAQMDRGMILPAAAESFKRFCGEDFCFLTWGPDDIPMLKDNFRIHGLPCEWLDKTYDLQVIFNQQTDGGSKQRSLEYAMEYFSLSQNLPAHDALNDAYFTALVAAKLDVKTGIARYDERQGKYLASSVIGDADTGDDGYVTVGEMLEDDVIAHPVCPLCGGVLAATGRPLHSRGQRYTYLLNCHKDGDMFLSLKVQRNLNETWRGKLTLTPATEAEIEDFRQKTKVTAAKRKSKSRRSSARRKKNQTQTDASTETAVKENATV